MSTPQKYIQVGRSYLAMAARKEGFVGIQSRRGTGKTHSILSTKIVAPALQYPGTRWLVTRSTRALLSTTILPTLENEVFPQFNIPFTRMDPSNRTQYHLLNGSVIIPQGMDDKGRSQSQEVAGVYVAEATELATANDLLAFAGALRQRVTVPAGFPPLVRQCFFDFNPSFPQHWVNQLCEPVPPGIGKVTDRASYDRLIAYNNADPPKGKMKRIITAMPDNPRFFDCATWDYTPDGKDYLSKLDYLTGYLRTNWLDGEWMAPEGSVFGNEFKEGWNTCKRFTVPASWPIFMVCDPGYHHPCGIAWITISWSGKIYIIGELYLTGHDVAAVASKIKTKEHEMGWHNVYRLMDPKHGWRKTMEGAGVNIADEFNKHHDLQFNKWPVLAMGEKDAAVQAVRRVLIDGTLILFNDLQSTPMEIQSWSYKDNLDGTHKEGDERYEDRNNHILDGLMGWLVLDFKFDFGKVATTAELPNPDWQKYDPENRDMGVKVPSRN